MKNNLHPSVVMVGTFPPPVHGMSAVNQAVREELNRAVENPVVIDISAPSHRRGIRTRLSRIPPVFRGLLSMASVRRLHGQALYMSVSGGLGQLYELLFLLLARSRGMRVFLHHHSFAYIDHPNRLTCGLIRTAGKAAVHIGLSPGMVRRLRATFPGVDDVVVVSNAALLLGKPPAAGSLRTNLHVLGFLGNISSEKGVHEFLNVCAAAREGGLALNAKLAGPFEDRNIESTVRKRLAVMPYVEYVGPQYGKSKAAFYEQIDALIFPTHYINEAEPLVIHEALRAGVPVIAHGRGAIPELIDGQCGVSVPMAQDFAAEAINQLKKWISNPRAFQNASKAAQARFLTLRSHGEHTWRDVRSRICNQARNPASSGWNKRCI